MARRTAEDVYAAVLDVKEDVLGVKADVIALKKHVNDDVESLRAIIDGKLDDDQLLTSLGFKMLNNRWFRWMFGALSTSILATYAVTHWGGNVGTVIRFILNLLSYLR
jgi:hypothetical protein